MGSLLRVRLHVNPDDYRPVVWPIKHPYWCSGSTDDHYIVVAYVESEEEARRLWPEITDIDVMEETDHYTFTSRFAQPEWWTPTEFPIKTLDSAPPRPSFYEPHLMPASPAELKPTVVLLGEKGVKEYIQRMAKDAGLE
jgi:hypothetical protein